MAPTELRDRVELALKLHVAPALELDGSAIEVVSVADGIASVRLTGACTGWSPIPCTASTTATATVRWPTSPPARTSCRRAWRRPT